MLNFTISTHTVKIGTLKTFEICTDVINKKIICYSFSSKNNFEWETQLNSCFDSSIHIYNTNNKMILKNNFAEDIDINPINKASELILDKNLSTIESDSILNSEKNIYKNLNFEKIVLLMKFTK